MTDFPSATKIEDRVASAVVDDELQVQVRHPVPKVVCVLPPVWMTVNHMSVPVIKQ